MSDTMDNTILLTTPERKILSALSRYQHLTCAQAAIAAGLSGTPATTSPMRSPN